MDEFELIRRHFSGEPALPPLVLGIGDDAALLKTEPGEQLVLCCDAMVEGRHFAPDARAADIGWKALAVNLSDLAAMGAEPRIFLLSLTLPEADDGWLTEFAGGLRECAQRFAIQLAGGDTTRGPRCITVTAVGTLPAGTALRRDRARVGDIVAVTGDLGAAAAALAGLGGAETGAALAARLHRPQPRLAAGQALRSHANAAIDVSDGLLADLGHVAAASGVGIDLRSDLLPACEALRQLPAARRLRWQATGGDDYELAVCLPPQQVAAAAAACAAVATPLTVIGRVVGGSQVRLLDADGVQRHWREAGFRHFGGDG